VKTIALIVVALAIAFALFRVGAHFEQIAFDRCIVEGPKKINEAYAKAGGVYEDQRRKWIDNLGLATKGRGDLSDAALTPPEKPDDNRLAEIAAALRECERSRIFVLR
jgi:hypothetical protein